MDNLDNLDNSDKREKLKISCPIIVEGKYDRLKILCVADAQVITTDGFGIFKKKEKLALFRALAKKTRLIVLADSDGAGKLIRSHISSAVPPEALIQLYIPKIEGKEQRKAQPSAEGTLGVEGMEARLIYDLLKPYEGGAECVLHDAVTKADLYAAGLSGGRESAARRDEFAASLGLPSGMTANALLAAARVLITRDEFAERFGL